jgi:hypothetical protein
MTVFGSFSTESIRRLTAADLGGLVCLLGVNGDFSEENGGKNKSNDKCKPIKFHFQISYKDFIP